LDSKIPEKDRTAGNSHPAGFFVLPSFFGARPWLSKLRTTEFGHAARLGRHHPWNWTVKLLGFFLFRIDLISFSTLWYRHHPPIPAPFSTETHKAQIAGTILPSQNEQSKYLESSEHEIRKTGVRHDPVSIE